jgi:flagellar biosynthesis/type III secretory pathway protein FliH
MKKINIEQIEISTKLKETIHQALMNAFNQGYQNGYDDGFSDGQDQTIDEINNLSDDTSYEKNRSNSYLEENFFKEQLDDEYIQYQIDNMIDMKNEELSGK